ncbi:hypothetical protein Cgig2_030324 [Carnegiea gigantea]|uniref:Uncharacterized protein n=1 Tax=Carnegiea gigantea TaxID=171969 RepID=A0A9Q1JLC0_9CARY|nr:hypothetical protein Cgig2_030324 [Carnegiea gigantea]
MVANVTMGFIINVHAPRKVLMQSVPRFERLSWSRKLESSKGHLNDENKCVDISKDYENYFNAIALKKVNTEYRGEGGYLTKDEFYPALHRLLGLIFQFRVLSTSMIGVMVWTKRVLIRFEEPLKQTSIFGAVGVFEFPYHFDTNVWRAFCELWCV